MERTPEFDAFGPWVYEVRAYEEVPPLYRSHPLDLASARMAIKIPRPIERRNANPHMHLYDHLLVAGGHGLTILSRVGDDGRYRTREIPYARVGAVQVSVSLLDGTLRLLDAAPGGDLPPVRFNGVSLGVIDRLVDLVLDHAVVEQGGTLHDGAPPVPVTGPEAPWTVTGPDVALVVAFRELAARRAGLARLADHPRMPVARRGGRVARVLDRLWPATLHAAVVAAQPGCVEVLHRRDAITTRTRPEHSVARTALLAPAVTSVTAREHPRYVGAVDVRFGVGEDAALHLAFPQGAPTLPALRAALGAGR
jgi:hypothetical protein